MWYHNGRPMANDPMNLSKGILTMTLFRVDLDLRGHCIATEIKKRYNQSLLKLLEIKARL